MSDRPDLPPIRKTQLMRDVESMFGGRDIRLVLVDLYNRLGSQSAVGRRLGLSQVTIHTWFDELGIRVVSRTQAKVKRRRTGSR
jgi:hypothetical protein